MIKFSEFVSLGHPDKIADYISQYLLDRYIEHDPQTRYAVEVQIKGYQVTLGGEVSSKHHFSAQEIRDFVRASVNEIGYTREYQQKWGADNTICGDLLAVAISANRATTLHKGCPAGATKAFSSVIVSTVPIPAECLSTIPSPKDYAKTCSRVASEASTSKRRSLPAMIRSKRSSLQSRCSMTRAKRP